MIFDVSDPGLIKEINALLFNHRTEEMERLRIFSLSHENRVREFISLFRIRKSSFGMASWYKDDKFNGYNHIFIQRHYKEFFLDGEDVPVIMPGSIVGMEEKRARSNMSKKALSEKILSRYLLKIEYTCLCTKKNLEFFSSDKMRQVGNRIAEKHSLPCPEIPRINKEMVMIKGVKHWVDESQLNALTACWTKYNKLSNLERKLKKLNISN